MAMWAPEALPANVAELAAARTAEVVGTACLLQRDEAARTGLHLQWAKVLFQLLVVRSAASFLMPARVVDGADAHMAAVVSQRSVPRSLLSGSGCHVPVGALRTTVRIQILLSLVHQQTVAVVAADNTSLLLLVVHHRCDYALSPATDFFFR